MKNKFLLMVLIALCTLLQGCFGIEEKILIHKDGSGTYTFSMDLTEALKEMTEMVQKLDKAFKNDSDTATGKTPQDLQNETYKKLKEDLGTKQYEPVVRKILELNLDRVYHLTPTQVFEVFVTEANGDSKENAKRYVEIYRNFEKILVVKKLEDDYANRSTKMLETSFAAFIKVAQDLDTYKRQIIHEIVATHGNISHPFAQDLSSIFIDWGIASKKLKRVGNEVSAVDDSELVNEEKINTVLITKTYLFDKLIVLFNKDEYVASPYRFTFVNLINNGMIQMKEYNVTVHYYKTGIQNNIDTLTKVNDSLKTQIKELRELHE